MKELNTKKEEFEKNEITKILEGNNFIISKSYSSQEYRLSKENSNIYYDDSKIAILIINKKERHISERVEIFNREREKGNVKNYELDLFAFKYEPILIEVKNIIQSEIIQDDISITKTSRGSQVGGALVGGVLAGGVGAIIGGLSGNQTNTGATRKVELVFTIDEPLNPTIKFKFLDEISPIKKDNPKYETAINEAIEWQKLISILLHRYEKEDNTTYTK
ncbi:hypothetical protein KGF86_06915 [Ornithinibacillus massiliensis]|uniref:Uncharacterized protein n=1 Tax=Ornithinibacillus massiliensis TaxID=1944633 RepID=A0ABS5MDW5_9BACI|nr:hypothetical protein [Ornithinibacillus massiliensis]